MLRGAYHTAEAVKSIASVLPAFRSPIYMKVRTAARINSREEPVAHIQRICFMFLVINSPHNINTGIKTNKDRKFIISLLN